MRKHKIGEQTLYGWRKRLGDLDPDPADVKRLRELEARKAKLQRMVAEREMAIDTPKEINRKSGELGRTLGDHHLRRHLALRQRDRPWSSTGPSTGRPPSAT